MLNAGHGMARQAPSQGDRPVIEVVVLALRNTGSEEFAGVMSGAIAHLCRAPGYLAHSFGPCAEEAGMFLLLVWWQSIEAHVVDFRQSADHVLWRSLLQSHLQSEPWVRHFEVSEGVGADGVLLTHIQGNTLNALPQIQD